MTVDWLHFDSLHALIGGGLIGLAAALLVLLNGRIAGVSGIVGGLLQLPRRGEVAWRIAFVAGLILAPVFYGLFATLPAARIEAGWGTLVLAGLLVGFGTRLGSGCTSGHGVCGLSRLSPRSMVATAIFMGTGIATVFVSRHVLGWHG
jgi:uncharacterized membrane protein YedE/YeeE